MSSGNPAPDQSTLDLRPLANLDTGYTEPYRCRTAFLRAFVSKSLQIQCGAIVTVKPLDTPNRGNRQQP